MYGETEISAMTWRNVHEYIVAGTLRPKKRSLTLIVPEEQTPLK